MILSTRMLGAVYTNRVFVSALMSTNSSVNEVAHKRLGSSYIDTLDNSSRVNPGIRVVPQQEEWFVERFGKFHRKLDPGLHLLIPFVDQIAYSQSLKQQMFDVNPQIATTEDNVQVEIDGRVYVQVVDSYEACYGAQKPFRMVVAACQAAMRAAVGEISLDEVLNNRTRVNDSVVKAVLPRANEYGVKVFAYEMLDITVESAIRLEMQRQSSAERHRREQETAAKAEKNALIYVAEGKRREAELTSEGKRIAQINEAQGEAEANLKRAEAQAKALEIIGKALRENPDAAQFDVAKLFTENWGKIAKEGNTLILPASPHDIPSMVAQAFGALNHIKGGKN